MVRAGQTVTLEEICLMNRRLIEEEGGLGVGFSNPGSLEYALEEILGSFFGKECCPTPFDKAATLGWRIIKGHVFIDGNKRTGIMSSMLLLMLYGIELKSTQEELIEVALSIAKGDMTIQDFCTFLRERSR